MRTCVIFLCWFLLFIHKKCFDFYFSPIAWASSLWWLKKSQKTIHVLWLIVDCRFSLWNHTFLWERNHDQVFILKLKSREMSVYTYTCTNPTPPLHTHTIPYICFTELEHILGLRGALNKQLHIFFKKCSFYFQVRTVNSDPVKVVIPVKMELHVYKS